MNENFRRLSKFDIDRIINGMGSVLFEVLEQFGLNDSQVKNIKEVIKIKLYILWRKGFKEEKQSILN